VDPSGAGGTPHLFNNFQDNTLCQLQLHEYAVTRSWATSFCFSVASALREVLPLFARGGEDLRMLNFLVDEAADLDAEPTFSLPAHNSRLAAWSPDGELLALVDPAKGLIVVELTEATRGTCHTLSDSLTNIQHIQWSPKGTYLVVQSPFKDENEEPNVQTWKRIDGEITLTSDAAFHNPKVERDASVFQWTADEKVCCRSLPDGTLQLLDGSDKD